MVARLFARKQKNMITVKAQKSVRAAADYFRAHFKDSSYHIGGAEKDGKWFGKLARELALSGQVDQRSFENLAGGRNPHSAELLTQRIRTGRVAYFDFVCSAPKSVSILALVAGDSRVEEAHKASAAKAFEFLERSACVRERTGSDVLTTRRSYTGRIVAAIFDHQESRANDCQLHRHCCVFNLTREESGKFKALDARRMYDHSQTATEVYRNELAGKLLYLGYSLQNHQHGFEIEGVPEALLRTFSKRSENIGVLIRQAENAEGRSLSKKEKSILVHRSRSRKRELSPDRFTAHLQNQISPTQIEELEKLVKTARGKRGRITGLSVPGKLHIKRRRIQVLRDTLILGRGKVSSAKVIRQAFNGGTNRGAEEWIPGVGRGNSRLASILMRRGPGVKINYLIRCMAAAASNIEKAIDLDVRIFK